jgi:TolA-binding protein
MKRLLLVVFVLIVAVGALAYWQGWFSMTKEGHVDVQVDTAKFKQDREAFSKTVGEQAKAMKDRVSSLWKKSEKLTDKEKAAVQKELGELEKKHNRLETQIQDLKGADESRFATLKKDLTTSLAQVDGKIEELTKKLEKAKEK